MAYASAADFELVIGTQETIEISNLDSPLSTSVNIPRLDSALEEASGEINGYLATRYQIPLSSTPAFIKNYCIDIAWYRMAQNNAPENFSTRYQNAIARLQDIEKGIMQLIDESGNLCARRIEELTDQRGFPLDDWTAHAGECSDSSFGGISIL